MDLIHPLFSRFCWEKKLLRWAKNVDPCTDDDLRRLFASGSSGRWAIMHHIVAWFRVDEKDAHRQAGRASDSTRTRTARLPMGRAPHRPSPASRLHKGARPLPVVAAQCTVEQGRVVVVEPAPPLVASRVASGRLMGSRRLGGRPSRPRMSNEKGGQGILAVGALLWDPDAERNNRRERY